MKSIIFALSAGILSLQVVAGGWWSSTKKSVEPQPENPQDQTQQPIDQADMQGGTTEVVNLQDGDTPEQEEEQN